MERLESVGLKELVAELKKYEYLSTYVLANFCIDGVVFETKVDSTFSCRRDP